VTRRLTLLSVTHCTADFVRFQAWTTRAAASGDFALRWRVIDTSPGQTDRQALSQCPGLELVDSDIATRWAHDQVDPRYSPRSWQHAQALNQLVGELDDEFGLIIDPDCFILRQNWDRALVAAMDQGEVDVIGAPWHPLRRFKFGAGLPTATFLLFRATSLQGLGLDFTPGPYPPVHSRRWRWPWLRWRYFGTWKDTGWRLAEAVRAGNLCSVAFDAPVLQPDPSGLVRRMTRRLVPAAMSFRPPDTYQTPSPGLVTSEEIASVPGGDRYEEYWWNDQPIACHLRAISQLKISFDSAEARFWTARIARNLGLQLDEFLAPTSARRALRS
jgi:hypothetical protein